MSTELLSIEEAAAVLGISRGHMANMRVNGTGPAFVKLGSRTVRYDRWDLENWLLTMKRRSTSEIAAIQAGAS